MRAVKNVLVACRLLSSRPPPITNILHHGGRQIRHISVSRSLHTLESPCWKRTVIAHQPTLTTKEDIISQLLPHGTENVNKRDKRHMVPMVILTTPSFATWLEDDTFMEQLLRSIVATHRRISEVVAAVVDKLPLPEHDGFSGKEGFAIMCGPKRASSSPSVTSVKIKEGNPDSRSTLTFSLRNVATSGYEEKGTFPRRLVIPLANTIFKNGKASTLLVQKWYLNSEKTKWEKRNQAEPNTFNISLAENEQRVSHVLIPHVPVISLTEPRKIVSSAGNIVREIAKNDPDGTVIPASQELESSVNDAFKKLDLPPQALKVWAVVSRKPEIESSQGSDTNSVTASEEIRYDNLTKFGYHQSHIHRVLSGGGGWGLKEGLLALDSQSELDLVPQFATKTSMEPFHDLAPPGCYIQFFLAANSSPGHVTVGTKPETDADNSLYKHTSIFGTTSSTIDDMPHTPLDGIELNQQATFSVYKFHFGALSEDGIFYLQLYFVKPHYFKTFRRTKLDIPGSWLQINATGLPGATIPPSDQKKESIYHKIRGQTKKFAESGEIHQNTYDQPLVTPLDPESPESHSDPTPDAENMEVLKDPMHKFDE